jgi:hypothetical protein
MVAKRVKGEERGRKNYKKGWDLRFHTIYGCQKGKRGRERGEKTRKKGWDLKFHAILIAYC